MCREFTLCVTDPIWGVCCYSYTLLPNAGVLRGSLEPGTSILGLHLKKDVGLNEMLSCSTGILQNTNVIRRVGRQRKRREVRTQANPQVWVCGWCLQKRATQYHDRSEEGEKY